MEDKPGSVVAEEILLTVNRIKQEHPETSIVVGEITPYHQRDKEVETCNTILRERIGKESVQLVKMDFLRDGTWSNFKSDRKHIKISSIPFFAGAYIAALRRAHNMPPKNRFRWLQILKIPIYTSFLQISMFGASVWAFRRGQKMPRKARQNGNFPIFDFQT